MPAPRFAPLPASTLLTARHAPPLAVAIAPIVLAVLMVLMVLMALMVLTGCTITLPQRALVLSPTLPPAPAVSSAPYRDAVAQRILDANPELVLHATPQAMLRSLVVVAFSVDRDGRLVQSSIYRSNGDDEAEAIALRSLRRAAAAAARESAQRRGPLRDDGKLAVQRQRAIPAQHQNQGDTAGADNRMSAAAPVVCRSFRRRSARPICRLICRAARQPACLALL
ncbi:MAG: hypothetical protein GAK40_00833 [Burkholderia plantarii]|nr:MAG: hypothetical protein GAK40_00833 [Burkholderia plantarii]